MSKINCETAGDLIPLYVDEVLSPSSVELVEEHLAECEDCTAKVETLKSSTVVKSYEDVKPIKKIQGKIKKGRIIAGAITAAVIFAAAFATAFFTDNVCFDYSYDDVKDKITVVSGSDGHNAVVMYDGKVDYAIYSAQTLVGYENGREQVEVTLYMTRRFSDMSRYYAQGKESSDFNGNFVIYACHPHEKSVVGCDNYKDFRNMASSEEYLAVKSWLDYEPEVVAVYYGKWTAYFGSGEPDFKGERHLLWKKQQ